MSQPGGGTFGVAAGAPTPPAGSRAPRPLMISLQSPILQRSPVVLLQAVALNVPLLPGLGCTYLRITKETRELRPETPSFPDAAPVSQLLLKHVCSLRGEKALPVPEMPTLLTATAKGAGRKQPVDPVGDGEDLVGTEYLIEDREKDPAEGQPLRLAGSSAHQILCGCDGGGVVRGIELVHQQLHLEDFDLEEGEG